jgi:hypothetical protein
MILSPPISSVGEEVLAFMGRDVRKYGGNSVVDGVAGAPFGLSQPVFELGKEHLDGIEIWGVLGQEEEPGADGPDGGADRLASMGSEIVHDDDIVWSKGWGEDLFDIEQEALAIDRPLDQPRRHHAIVSQGGDEGQGLPAAVRNLGRQGWPRGAQPRRGAMLVLVQVSSMKTRREGSIRF